MRVLLRSALLRHREETRFAGAKFNEPILPTLAAARQTILSEPARPIPTAILHRRQWSLLVLVRKAAISEGGLPPRGTGGTSGPFPPLGCSHRRITRSKATPAGRGWQVAVALATAGGAAFGESMRLLDSYIIRQILGPFLFFVLVFTGVIWLTQSLRVIDTVVNNGESARVFLESRTSAGNLEGPRHAILHVL